MSVYLSTYVSYISYLRKIYPFTLNMEQNCRIPTSAHDEVITMAGPVVGSRLAYNRSLVARPPQAHPSTVPRARRDMGTFCYFHDSVNWKRLLKVCLLNNLILSWSSSCTLHWSLSSCCGSRKNSD